MRDTEVHEEDTSHVEIEYLVTPAARIAELELQVQNLEQLIAKAQEDKEQSKILRRCKFAAPAEKVLEILVKKAMKCVRECGFSQ